jgi:hypothetical protein
MCKKSIHHDHRDMFIKSLPPEWNTRYQYKRMQWTPPNLGKKVDEIKVAGRICKIERRRE